MTSVEYIIILLYKLHPFTGNSGDDNLSHDL